MENKYQRGRIYKIVDVGYNKCYIGSTIEKLSNRMSGHRNTFKSFSRGVRKGQSSCKLFEEFGVEHCKIELIENYPCETKDELHRREGYYIQNTDCVNKLVAGRTKPEWIEANKEHLKTYKAEHHQKNKEKYNKMSSDNYYSNREHFSQINKEYREKTKSLLRLGRSNHLYVNVERHTHTVIKQDI